MKTKKFPSPSFHSPSRFKSALLLDVVPALVMVLLSLVLYSCQEENADQPSPAAKVPEWVVGKWKAGHFSMGEFWNRDGSFAGNAIEVGIAFDFKADGKCAFYFVTGGTSYGCRTEAFVYEKGTVAFLDNNSFTFTPWEGNARGFYKGCASSYQNYNKKHKPEDLKPQTYFYSRAKDSQGNDQLVLRFKPEAQNSTPFFRDSW